jgi:hypothetical protein
MAFHAMVEVGRRTICDLSVLPLPDDATSIRDVFEEELTKGWKGDVDPALPERIIATGLRPSRMQADGFKKREIDDVTDAVKHSAKRVLPLVNTRVLVPLFEEPVTRLGPFFGIDHKNISRAVPMSDAARSDHETRISPLLEA